MKNRLEFAFTATVMEIETDIYMYSSQSRDCKSGIFCRYLYFFELLSIVEPFYLNK